MPTPDPVHFYFIMRPKPVIDHALIKQIQQRPDKLYHVYYQPKKKFGSPQIGKDGAELMRKITRPVDRLKIIQQQIHTCLKEIKLPNCMYGGVHERTNFDNAISHKGSRYFLTIDLRNFFGNISNSIVYQTLINNGFSWKEAREITMVSTYKGALPQGAPTSTTLANLSFAPTAIILENFCRERNITFTVFVDYLAFSSSQCFEGDISKILQIIKDSGYFVNHKKVHYKKNCCEITGLYVNRGKLSLHKNILANVNKPGIKEYVDAVKNKYDKHKKAAQLS